MSSQEITDDDGKVILVPHQNHLLDLLFGENSRQHWFWLSIIAGGSQLVTGILIFFFRSSDDDINLSFALMLIGSVILVLTLALHIANREDATSSSTQFIGAWTSPAVDEPYGPNE